MFVVVVKDFGYEGFTTTDVYGPYPSLKEAEDAQYRISPIWADIFEMKDLS